MRLHALTSVYLDICALGRPYDEQNDLRIAAETTAVNIIIALIKSGDYLCYHSPVHDYEAMRNSDESERTEILLLLNTYGASTIEKLKNVYHEVEQRVVRFEKRGMKIIDALHVAHAEAAGAAFITCDDDLMKKCRKAEVTVWYGSPVDFCRRENLL